MFNFDERPVGSLQFLSSKKITGISMKTSRGLSRNQNILNQLPELYSGEFKAFNGRLTGPDISHSQLSLNNTPLVMGQLIPIEKDIS